MKHLMKSFSTQTAYPLGWNNIVVLMLILWLSEISAVHSLAQPPITSSGLNTQIDLSSNPPTGQTQYDITGGTRAGTNLFHSFKDFNVPNNNIANFLNDTRLPTTSILGRVTGDNPSMISGMIQTTGYENANLFLMNPSGIVFGPTASLNVGGSVTFTTADYLRLAEINGTTGLFHADPAFPNVLLSTPIAAFGFLGPNPSAIALRGSTLTTRPGQSISLIGGNITVESSTLANNRNSSTQPNTSTSQINFASVASPGEVLTGTLDYAPNINDQSFGALGTIQVLEKSVIDASGNGGGTVLIRGGHFVLDNSKISANVTRHGTIMNGVESIGGGINVILNHDAAIRNNATIETNVLGNATPNIKYAGVQVKADRIEIVGAGSLSADSFTGIQSNVGTGTQPNTSGGKSGNIALDANSILIKGFGTLETTVNGVPLPPGSSPTPTQMSDAGHITLTANQDIELNGSRIQSFISSHGGTAGNILLTSRHGNIKESGNLLPPGFIPVPGAPLESVTPNMLFSQARLSTGKAGDITFNAPKGDIQLAGAQIVLAIQPIPGGPPTQEAGSGRGHFAANNLLLINNSSVQMDNFSTLPVGDFSVLLNGSLTLDNSRIITTARGPAQAADLNITAKSVGIINGATLSTDTASQGPGGHLTVVTDNLQLLNGGQLRSGSTIPPQFPNRPPPPIPSGAGGLVTVQSQAGHPNSVMIDGHDSGIFTGTQGTGLGGTINLSTQSLTVQNSGKISAETTGTSPMATGGSINITATDQVTLTNGASITARSTGLADAGTISINAGQQLDVIGTSTTKSSITTEAKQAQGGDIKIQAIDRVRVVDGEISTSVRGGAGSGGNITIDPKVVILQNSAILAQANRGNGGDILITTPVFVADQSSRVDASTPFGLNGRVTIQSPTSNLSGTVGQLVSKTSPPQVLLQNRCVALAGGEQSTFLLSGRDAVPAEPGGWLSSPVPMEHWTGEETEHASGLMVRKTGSRRSPSIAAHKHDPQILSLRRLIPSGFLVRTFATGSTGCPS